MKFPMRIGLDLIDLDDFTKTVQNGGQSFLRQNFTQDELSPGFNIQNLAGKFAAKEAVFKTGYLKEFKPLSIQILNNENGSPSVVSLDGVIIDSLSVSITHTKTTAAAAVIWHP